MYRNRNNPTTGISFAGFERTVEVGGDREIPRSLVRVLSRLVVLRTRCCYGYGRIQGPLVALIKLLPFRHTRVLDLQGCCLQGEHQP